MAAGGKMTGNAETATLFEVSPLFVEQHLISDYMTPGTAVCPNLSRLISQLQPQLRRNGFGM